MTHLISTMVQKLTLLSFCALWRETCSWNNTLTQDWSVQSKDRGLWVGYKQCICRQTNLSSFWLKFWISSSVFVVFSICSVTWEWRCYRKHIYKLEALTDERRFFFGFRLKYKTYLVTTKKRWPCKYMLISYHFQLHTLWIPHNWTIWVLSELSERRNTIQMLVSSEHTCTPAMHVMPQHASYS